MDVLYGLLAGGPAGILAQAKASNGSSAYLMWGLIAVMLVVFYFLLIRPQRRRAQEHDQMVSGLTKGDEIVTIGGIHGVIKKIIDDRVVVEVADGVEMTFLRSAIARPLTVKEPEAEEEPEDYEEEPGAEEEEYEEAYGEQEAGEPEPEGHDEGPGPGGSNKE